MEGKSQQVLGIRKGIAGFEPVGVRSL